MKPYRVLKAFNGSQTGNDGPFHFEPGDEPVMLSDHLAEVVLKEGWVEPMAAPSAPVEDRETKVEAVAETKVEAAEEVKAPAKKKSRKAA